MKNQRDFSAFLIAIACALALIFTVLFLSFLPLDRATVARRDYIVYWATGQQLVHHGNPYDPTAISQIEHDAGFQGGASYYMRNTPWALPLAFPLGFVSPMAAALPWSLLMLGLLFVSVRILWKLYGGAANSLDWLGYCFPPALWCVILGQTSIFLLFGFTLFLRFHKSRPFAAGAAFWLCSIKPHLFLPFAVVLLVWIFVARAWRILAGAVTAFAAGALVTTWIDPAAWSQYAYYMRTSVVTREFTPCLADLLRDAIQANGGVARLCPGDPRLPLGPRLLLAPPPQLGLASNRAACSCSSRCWSRPSAGSSISRSPCRPCFREPRGPRLSFCSRSWH